MFSHITLGSNDLKRSRDFYDAVLPILGLSRRFYDEESGWVIYAPPGETSGGFFVCRPIDGKPASVGNGTTIGLLAPDPETVNRFFDAAISAGGKAEGAPGTRPNYSPDFYGAYVRDPEGHKICCMCLLEQEA
ncbi:VOC family protein [Telmatospirillum sp. J64-1]|uniref:VOC family protein n=1 Tax=Telmatospirillum sp. J64-1 TaxID=2502183 RepID=UPI00115D65DF|nr:VOC family protein [Telmatospirillum sp. J64-1]